MSVTTVAYQGDAFSRRTASAIVPQPTDSGNEFVVLIGTESFDTAMQRTDKQVFVMTKTTTSLDGTVTLTEVKNIQVVSNNTSNGRLGSPDAFAGTATVWGVPVKLLKDEPICVIRVVNNGNGTWTPFYDSVEQPVAGKIFRFKVGAYRYNTSSEWSGKPLPIGVPWQIKVIETRATNEEPDYWNKDDHVGRIARQTIIFN